MSAMVVFMSTCGYPISHFLETWTGSNIGEQPIRCTEPKFVLAKISWHGEYSPIISFDKFTSNKR